MTPSPDMTLLSDSDDLTCISPPPMGHKVSLNVPTGLLYTSSPELSVQVRAGSTCDVSKLTVRAMIHTEPRLDELLGRTLKTCTASDKTTSGDLTSYVFTCTCTYGYCESVYLVLYGIPLGNCFEICTVAGAV